jgi:hypothetical protein
MKASTARKRAPASPSSATESFELTAERQANFRTATSIARETPEHERTSSQRTWLKILDETDEKHKRLNAETEQAFAEARKRAAAGADLGETIQPIARDAFSHGDPFDAAAATLRFMRALGPWPKAERKRALKTLEDEARRRLNHVKADLKQSGRDLAQATHARRRAQQQQHVQTGHASRRGENARQVGSRRSRTSTSSSSQDPGESDEPEPPSRAAEGAEPRWCRNPAHEIFGGRVDLNAFPWVDPAANYCHGACRQQAYRVRGGTKPSRLATPPEGWGAEPPNIECLCDFAIEDLRIGSSRIRWQTRTPICVECNAPASSHRIVFGRLAVPRDPTREQWDRLWALCRFYLAAKRVRMEAQRSGLTGRRVYGGPRFRSSSYVNVKTTGFTTRTGLGNSESANVGFLRERRTQREIEQALDGADSQDDALATVEVPLPDEAEAARAAEAHGDHGLEGVAA